MESPADQGAKAGLEEMGALSSPIRTSSLRAGGLLVGVADARIGNGSEARQRQGLDAYVH